MSIVLLYCRFDIVVSLRLASCDRDSDALSSSLSDMSFGTTTVRVGLHSFPVASPRSSLLSLSLSSPSRLVDTSHCLTPASLLFAHWCQSSCPTSPLLSPPSCAAGRTLSSYCQYIRVSPWRRAHLYLRVPDLASPSVSLGNVSDAATPETVRRVVGTRRSNQYDIVMVDKEKVSHHHMFVYGWD